ncbi:MAG TPA: hypothetical protein PLU22_08940 [Polyangiaceae bacterium]|nr:hypothetical protein [Polyangiaceae bacterium]
MKSYLLPSLAFALGSAALGGCSLDEGGAGGADTSTGSARVGEGGAGERAGR